MNRDNIIKTIIISLIVMLVLSILGISYAYFSLIIEGKSNNMITEMGSLRLKYEDTDTITLENIMPGDSVNKVITVKNVGTLNVSYNLVWEELYNTFINDEITIEAKCTRLNSDGSVDGTCDDLVTTPIKKIKIKTNISIEPNVTHKYDIKINFKETGENQNYNKKAIFSGKIGLANYTSSEPVYCTYDGELTQGVEYTNGQYTYRYMQEFDVSLIPQNSSYTNSIPATFMSTSSGLKDASTKMSAEYTISWSDITEEGWGVALNSMHSTEPVNSKLCSYINGKPIVSMKNTFAYSNASSINLDSIDTSNVVNMSGMFWKSSATKLDLSNFDTSKVTSMQGMFDNSQATILDVSNFDTSNVTDMNSMFWNSKLTSLYVDSFDTSKVIDMGGMFGDDFLLSMLDLSSFDTSSVTDMSYMFYGCSNLKSIYSSSKFVTTNVTDSGNMFSGTKNLVGGAGTTYDSTKDDKTYAHIDGGTSSPGYFTLKN